MRNLAVTDSSGNTTPGAFNTPSTQGFNVDGTTATISDPGAGGTIDINVLSDRNWIDVVFKAPQCASSACATLNDSSITSPGAKFTLGGPGLGSLALDTGKSAVRIVHGVGNGDETFRFWLTGQAAASGTVTLTFLANSWSYYLPTAPVVSGVPVLIQPTSGGAIVPPVSVQLTIPDANVGQNGNPAGTTDSHLTGYSVDPNSVNFTPLTLTFAARLDPQRLDDGHRPQPGADARGRHH